MYKLDCCEGNRKMNGKRMMACALALACTQVWSADASELKTDKHRLSYSIGASIGKNLKNEGADVDMDVLIASMKTALTGDKLLLSEAEIRKVMNDYQAQMRQTAIAKKQKALGENKKSGEAYLTQYQAQPGVQALPSGVLYKIVKAGTGKKPMESDMIEVNYRGVLTSGLQFDATEPGKPANLKISSLIAGWKQALVAMPTGSKWQIVIPAALAYGERGVGNDIGPNEVLVFDVELLTIK